MKSLETIRSGARLPLLRDLAPPAGATPEMRETLSDFAASDWLKSAIHALLRRDALDAVSDAELLGSLFRARFEAMLRVGHRLHGKLDDQGSVGPIMAIGAALWIGALYALANAAILGPVVARLSEVLG